MTADHIPSKRFELTGHPTFDCWSLIFPLAVRARWLASGASAHLLTRRFWLLKSARMRLSAMSKYLKLLWRKNIQRFHFYLWLNRSPTWPGVYIQFVPLLLGKIIVQTSQVTKMLRSGCGEIVETDYGEGNLQMTLRRRHCYGESSASRVPERAASRVGMACLCLTRSETTAAPPNPQPKRNEIAKLYSLARNRRLGISRGNWS